MELGIATVFRSGDSLQKDAMGTLKAISDIGYRNIEFANHAADVHPGCGFPMEAAELKKVLSDLGLKAVSCHVHPLNKETIARVLDYQEEMGNRNIVFGMSFFNSEDDVLRLADQMNEIARIAGARGFMTFYHNHFHEFQKFGGRYVLDILMDNTDASLVGMQLDTYWAQRGGQDPVAWLKKLGGRCEMIHQKDLPKGVSPVSVFETLPEDPRITMETFMQVSKVDFFTEVATGMMDIPAIIKAAETNNAKYIIVEQDHTRLTELESIKVSHDAIMKLLNK